MSPLRRARAITVGIVACVSLGLVAAGCGSGSDAQSAVTTKPVQSPPPQAQVPAPVAPDEEQAAAVGSFTGAFATSDGFQICEATAADVACYSTPSGQQVRLDSAGATYEGETGGEGFPLDADTLEGTVLTPSGISCLRSARGIECSRGGHGFRIGDWAVVTLKGPSETRHDSPNTPEGPEPAPASGPDPGAPEDLSQRVLASCDLFLTRQAAQDSYEAAPELFADLVDVNGVVCGDLPEEVDLGGSYGGVDLSVDAPASVGSDGYWAETCPAGSCYGAISDANGLPRTTFVEGYTRADGTEVGSYYRSSP
jgi:hypothetical protein